MPPAARVRDIVKHLLPPFLTPGPGSPNVRIGGMRPWRGVPAAAAAAIETAKQTSDAVIKKAEEATLAAAGTPGAPLAYEAEQTAKEIAAKAMGSLISSLAGGADKHKCKTPKPKPPHGTGVVTDGSQTVLINNLPACREGDTIVEPLARNKIVKGERTVIIGG